MHFLLVILYSMMELIMVLAQNLIHMLKAVNPIATKYVKLLLKTGSDLSHTEIQANIMGLTPVNL